MVTSFEDHVGVELLAAVVAAEDLCGFAQPQNDPSSRPLAPCLPMPGRLWPPRGHYRGAETAA
eukprot:2178178-Heterocapsa_arctica.AAC.1